jgi:hypothetical protein
MAQMQQVATWLRDMKLVDVARAAANGSPEAKTALKIAKGASSYAQKHGGK